MAEEICTSRGQPSRGAAPPRAPKLKHESTCAFCPSTKLDDKITGEHLWPEWMHDYLPKYHLASPFRSMHTVGLGRIGDPANLPNPPKVGGLHAKRPVFHQKLYVVCQTKCNGGWMSRLENQAKQILKPFLQGRWVTLTESEQHIVARWAALRTMIIEFADPTTALTDRGGRLEFANGGSPPKNWCIWIGQYSGDFWCGTFNHFGLVNTVPLSEYSSIDLSNEWLNFQTTSFCVGCLFIHTFSAKNVLPPLAADTKYFFARKYGLLCIWPDIISGPYIPPPILSDAAADAASHGFCPPEDQKRIRRAWETY